MMSTDAKGYLKAQALAGVDCSCVCACVCFLPSPKSLISLLHLAATLLSLQHTCTLGRAVLIFFFLHADGSHILLCLDWHTAYICPLPASIPLMAQPRRLN